MNDHDEKTVIRLCAAFMAFMVLAAYSSTLNYPFFLDDDFNIVKNPSIRSLVPRFGHLMDVGWVSNLAARPVVNYSLAVNYSISGLDTFSYHVFNLVVHVLASLMLFGLLRRGLKTERFMSATKECATQLAFFTALFWALHPINTSCVTYIVQRCESMMGLLYFSTLYFALRGFDSPQKKFWHSLAVLSFFSGVFTKEMIVSAPLVFLVFDRSFLSGSFRKALSGSRLLYIGFVFGWAVLFTFSAIVLKSAEVSNPWPHGTWVYIITQPEVVFHHLRLLVWPVGLCFDKMWIPPSFSEVWPKAFVMVSLGIFSLWGLYKRRAAGFLVFWFFAVLSPSLLVNGPNFGYEYRNYAAFPAIILLITSGIKILLDNARKRFPISPKTVVLAGIAVSVALLAACYNRNLVFASEISLWEDTLKTSPDNPRANLNLGLAYLSAGRTDDARILFLKAIKLMPEMGSAYLNLGVIAANEGKLGEALEYFRQASIARPNDERPYSNMGVMLLKMGRFSEAVSNFEKALSIRPYYLLARTNLSIALGMLGRWKESLENANEALRIAPDSAQVHGLIAEALIKLGRSEEAAPHLKMAEELSGS